MSAKRKRRSSDNGLVPIVFYYVCRSEADSGGFTGRTVREGPVIDEEQVFKDGGSASKPLYRSGQNFVSHWREYDTLLVPRKLLEKLLAN